MPKVIHVRRSDSPRGCRTPCNSTPERTIVKSEFTPSPHLLDHGYGATPINQLISPTPAAAPSVKRKLNLETHYNVVPLSTRYELSARHEFKTPQPKKIRLHGQIVSRKNTRYDTSLSLLTKKFQELIEKSPNGVVDLNLASNELMVQKRRIYDITNVLEGIGLLEKKSKNNIQWKGSKDNVGKHYLHMKHRLKLLEDRENQLDRQLELAERELRNLSSDKYGYVSYQDLRSVPKMKHKTVMAIKAPPNTHLSVPTGEDDILGNEERYSIRMKSADGPIEVFLCPEPQSPVKPKVIPPMDPLLRELRLSPAFDFAPLATPPVPQLDDSPPTHRRPISSQVCRSLSFTNPKIEIKEEIDIDSNPLPGSSTSGGEENTSVQPVQDHLVYNPAHAATVKMDDSLVESPSRGSNVPIEQQTPGTVLKMMFGDAGISPLVNRFSGTHPSVHTGHSNTGGMDPFFGPEALVSLEPIMQTEYNFGLDATEGLADLFDMDFGSF